MTKLQNKLSRTSTLGQSLKLIALQAGVLFLLQLAISVFDVSLSTFGLIPRHLEGLSGIVTAPFAHRDWTHLTNNALGLSALSGLCLLYSRRYYILASLFIIVCSGILVWLFGRPAYHLGASGWVFGLWGLLLYRGWLERKFKSIIISVFVAIFYGGMVFGLLPQDDMISYEYHIFGALSGGLFAHIYYRINNRNLL